MKKVFLTLALVAILCGQSSAVVINQYWDINTDAGAGGNGTATPTGTWNAANTNWNTVAAGTGAPTIWGAGNVAVFSAGGDATGAFAVTVTGTQSLSGLTVEEGAISETGGTL